MKEVLINEDEIKDLEESLEDADTFRDAWNIMDKFITDMKNRLTKYKLQ